VRPGSATSLYLDAARHVSARQLVGRARRLVPPCVVALGTSTRAQSASQLVARGVGLDPAPQWGPVTGPERDHTFRAYGHSRHFSQPDLWTDTTDGLLFLFHLHGFAPLAEYAAGPTGQAGNEFWREVISSWLSQTTKPSLPGWHPYPTSMRLVSWSAAISAINWPDAFRDRLADEISRQARYLTRSVEHDIGGNHVIKNAVALVVAGCVVPSSRVLERGIGLLRRELSRQFLSDGGHEERSTSYHRVVTQDLGDAAAVLERSGRRVPEWLSTAIAAADRWLKLLAGPDGRLPLLNDSWEGPAVGSPASDATSYLPDSGYVVFRRGGEHAVFDVGPLSPPHLPPHAHADALSFVLWADGKPVLVDPGSYSYTGPWRNHFRSTAAHNTVEVDSKDQCEFWGDFRAGFLPRVRATPIHTQGDVAVVAGCHDGYCRLPDPVEHHRSFIWWPAAGVIIVDMLRARRQHGISSALHFAPGLILDGNYNVSGFEVAPLGPVGDPTPTDDCYSPSLGTKVASTTLRYEATIAPGIPFGWSLLRPGFSVVSVDSQSLLVSRRGQPSVEVPLPWL
jgi:Heparinase II/III-like protein/Heparinase II/III N-terminus